MVNLQPDRRTVSLSPSAFVEPNLCELPADEVIRMYHQQEAKRKRTGDDYGQCDVPIAFRSAPEGLIIELDNIANHTGFRRSVITKCLSHHVLSWYQNMPQVVVLSKLYWSVRNRSGRYPDVIRRMGHDDYEFTHPVSVDGVAFLRTVSFVLGSLGDLSIVLGVPSYKLFLAGLCWSVSTNLAGWAQESVRQFFTRENDAITAYINERVLLFGYADDVLRYRSGELLVADFLTELNSRVNGGA